MIRWFQGDSQDPERALQCWQILISKASNRQTVRFSALAEMMGFNDPLSVLPALEIWPETPILPKPSFS